MSIKEKYSIPDKITAPIAKKLFDDVLAKYKREEVDINELSLVAGILNARPEPNLTITKEDSNLSIALEAAEELDYYEEFAKDSPQLKKFKQEIERYWQNLK